MDQLYKTACGVIDAEAQALASLSQTIWTNPELNFQEVIAHRALTDFLEQRGFMVERHYKDLDTAFRAVWCCYGNEQDSKKEEAGRPHVVVICEYDALPEIGHACGHNLIAQAGVAAGLGIKAAMLKHGAPLGKLTVLGTPAEESDGGKVDLIKAGAFDDVDFAMMVHPAHVSVARPQILAARGVVVTYHGQASHASAAPWEGINALDATVQAYNNISALRQQIKPTSRIHGIITKGGAKSNIIPELSQLEYIVRSATGQELELLTDKVDGCFRAAALASGCKLDIDWDRNTYLDFVSNPTLEQLYQKHVETVEPRMAWLSELDMVASTDMGNVSYVVPSIHPFYHIGGTAINHTREFTALAGSPEAQTVTQNQGKALAMTALDVLADPSLLAKIKDQFSALTHK